MACLIVLCCASPLVAQQPPAALEPLPPDPQLAPYQPARLTLRNDSQHVVDAVRLRWQAGGPTVELRTALPPGQTQTFQVPLVAVSVVQVYDVQLLSDRRPVAEAMTRIDWPDDQAVPDAFIDPFLLGRYDTDFPAWSPRLRALVLLVGVLTVPAAALILLLPWQRLRAAALVGLIGAASFAMLMALPTQRRLEIRAPLGAMEEELLIVAAARTSEWFTSGLPAPVYYSREHMRYETLILRPDGRSTVVIHPQEIRVLRLP